MPSTADVLAEQLDRTREWTLKLIADLRGDDWFFQPARAWRTRFFCADTSQSPSTCSYTCAA